MELEALLLEQTLELLGDLAVHARQDAIEEFDDDDFGAQPTPDRAELKADDAGADDDQLLRRRGEVERAGRGDDDLLVDLDARQTRDVRAGGDDDVLGFNQGLAAVGALDRDLPGGGDAGLALDPFDFVLLEQKGHAVDVGGDGIVLVLRHRDHVERRRVHDNAERRHPVSGFLEHLGSIEQRLRRDAADVEAGPAQRLALLDDGDLHAELRRADRADISAGAGADHDDIISHASTRGFESPFSPHGEKAPPAAALKDDRDGDRQSPASRANIISSPTIETPQAAVRKYETPAI